MITFPENIICIDHAKEQEKIKEHLVTRLRWGDGTFQLFFICCNSPFTLSEYYHLIKNTLPEHKFRSIALTQPDIASEKIVWGIFNNYNITEEKEILWLNMMYNPNILEYDKARFQTLCRLNERRGVMLKYNKNSFVFIILPYSTYIKTFEIAPDLWSIRTIQININ